MRAIPYRWLLVVIGAQPGFKRTELRHGRRTGHGRVPGFFKRFGEIFICRPQALWQRKLPASKSVPMAAINERIIPISPKG